MPGHDHSIVPKLKPGDLGTRDAFFLWNCPIQDEGLSIRQHVIELVQPLITFGGTNYIIAYYLYTLSSFLPIVFPFSLNRAFQEYQNLTAMLENNRNYLSDSYGDFLYNNDEYLWTPVRTYYKKRLL